jgi:HrpA-like RNA helicase
VNYLDLPVYKHKELILSALETNQVIVVESPTGSGKTTQLPVILYDAGYGNNGVIGVTQPRRIAALSVSEFIARQVGSTLPGGENPGIIGYKMRFEDKTSPATKIKIMTDGILLQEMKLDPWLTKYGCIIVDEAHERSLNIDFILGLLKRVLETRKEFKVIVSSATINAQVFSEYFGGCPIVKIDAVTYPVTIIYDPLAQAALPKSFPYHDEVDPLLIKITAIIERVVVEKRPGDILIFLSGEKIIKDCITQLATGSFSTQLHLIPLYGRLGKEEQERVFEEAPRGKTKVIISTNIAETSVTIDGVTSVIDSGLAKLNYYNPRTFTSSLIEGPVSKASANQRKGRAGRTQEGSCYRLYTRKDFENRALFTIEEIYRTDLSEVVLRMSDLGITEFEEFNFISPPGREDIIAAIETLNLLDALEQDRTLSKTGAMMTEFPLAPRQSRIIVEAMLRYPSVIEETIIAAAFLSTQSPYILPPGEELAARHAHHQFRDGAGDFISYLKLYRNYLDAPHRGKFCEKSYLDPRAMAEIINVVVQLEEIVSQLGIPITGGGPHEDYLCCVARGMIQFVCVHEGRGLYRSLTAGSILIHPGSVMFRMEPPYIVAGEIVRTSRMYAMSVSPLSKSALMRISPGLFDALCGRPVRKSGRGDGERKAPETAVKIAGEVFDIKTIKKKKLVVLPWERLSLLKEKLKEAVGTDMYKNDKGVVVLNGEWNLLAGEKLSLILQLVPTLDMDGALEKKWPKKERFTIRERWDALSGYLPLLVTPAVVKPTKKDLGFIGLYTDGLGSYWFSCSRGFLTSLNESIASLETLIDELDESIERGDFDTKNLVNQTYRRLSDYAG